MIFDRLANGEHCPIEQSKPKVKTLPSVWKPQDKAVKNYQKGRQTYYILPT